MEPTSGGSRDAAPYPNPHPPEQRRLLSNIGHWVEGGILAATSGLALVDAVDPRLGWPGRWWPRLAVGSGLALGTFIVGGTLHHGGPRVYLRHEHSDRQHLQMAGLLAAGGTLEAVSPGRYACAGMPAALAGVGLLFLTHEQHGTGEARAAAERVHGRLAWSLIATAAAKSAEALGLPGRWELVWPCIGLATAAQLVAYREPEQAFE